MYFVAAHRHRAGGLIGRPEKKSLATSVANPARLRHLPTARITVSAGRRSNAEYRKREHLTAAEIDKLIEAAKGNRHGHRDATMILVAYRHGLRASELCELRWEDLNFGGATLNVSRKKSGTPSTHPLFY
jgi:integrase